MNLDRELVAQAARVLGTAGATATVHAAMRTIIDGDAAMKLLDFDFGLSPEDVARMRERPAAD